MVCHLHLLDLDRDTHFVATVLNEGLATTNRLETHETEAPQSKNMSNNWCAILPFIHNRLGFALGLLVTFGLQCGDEAVFSAPVASVS